MLADGYNGAMWIELAAGEFDTAISMGREGKRLGKSIGSIWGQVGALSSIAVAYLEKGEIDRTMSCMNEARRLAQEADMHTLVFLGLPYLTLADLTVGNLEQAGRHANQLYDERDSMIQTYRRTSLAISAEVKIRTGQFASARHILAEAFEDLSLDEPLLVITRWLMADAYLHLAQEEPQRSLERMEYLVDRMHQAGVRHYLPEGLLLQGKALLALDEPELARAVLLDARKVARETGARRNLWQILWELSQLETAAGNISDASLYKQQAQETVNYIADHTGSEELRASFLSLPEVMSVLAN